MQRYLFDTNVLIYGIDSNSEFHERSREYVSGKNEESAICSISLSEAYSVLTRKRGYGMEAGKALNIIRWYQENFRIIYPNSESTKFLNYLVSVYEPVGMNIFDLEIAAVGIANDYRTIITRNLKDFKHIVEIKAIW